MAVRTDQVQLRVDFITDAARQLARTLNQTKEYTREIDNANRAIKKYEAEARKANTTEQRRAELTRLIAAEQEKVVANQRAIVAEGKKIENLDLNKVAPQQLVERMRQIKRELSLIADQTSPTFKGLQAELGRVDAQLKKIGTTAKQINVDGQQAGGGGIGGFLGSVVGKATLAIAAVQAVWATLQGVFNYAVTAVRESREARAADAALVSRLESTGNAAGRTLEELGALADELEGKTLFSAEQIKKGEELLLTFTNIRDEVLDETIPLMLDLSSVLKRDVQSSALQLGKALNNPIKGLQALSDAGITFSPKQQKMIRTFVETNRLAEAQGVILAEVRTQVEGAAEAAATATKGGLRNLEVIYGRISENIGTLIDRGLKRLAPVLETVLTVVDKAVQSFLSGEAATGEFSTAANVLSGVLSGISFVFDAIGLAVSAQIKVFQFLGGVFEFVAEKAQPFIAFLRQIPGLTTAVNVLRDAFNNLGATAAGIGAAITDLFTNWGRNMGGAYRDARDAVLAEEKKALEEEEAALAKKRGEFTVGGVDPEELKKRRAAAAKIREDAFKEALAQAEAAQKIQELQAEAAYYRGIINEQTYQARLSAAVESGLADRVAVYERFGKQQTEAALALQVELAKIELARRDRGRVVTPLAGGSGGGPVTSQADNVTDSTLDVAGAAGDIQLAALRSRFEAALISEQEYNLRSLELKQQLVDQELAILRNAAEPQWAAIRDKEEEKRRIESEIGQARLENERRLEQVRQQLTEASLSTAQDFFGTVAELLAEDEKARKKYASAIKAFQIAEVTIAGITEVQRIWANSAQFGPFGAALAAIQSAIAVGRTVAAIARIDSQKFARGGFTGRGYGVADETGYKPAGVVHQDEWVAPKWMVESPDTAPIIRGLEMRRTRGYAEGGFVTANTTPSSDIAPVPGAAGDTATLRQVMEGFSDIVDRFPRQVEAYISFQNQESAEDRVAGIRRRAVI